MCALPCGVRFTSRPLQCCAEEVCHCAIARDDDGAPSCVRALLTSFSPWAYISLSIVNYDVIPLNLWLTGMPPYSLGCQNPASNDCLLGCAFQLLVYALGNLLSHPNHHRFPYCLPFHQNVFTVHVRHLFLATSILVLLRILLSKCPKSRASSVLQL